MGWSLYPLQRSDAPTLRDGIRRGNSRSRRRCFREIAFYPKLLQKRSEGPFASQEFLDRDVYVARIARLVDFRAQPVSGILIKVTVFGLFEDRCHVRGDGVRRGVPVIARVVLHQMSEVSDPGRIGGDGKENFAEILVREWNDFLGVVLMDLSVQSQVGD